MNKKYFVYFAFFFLIHTFSYAQEVLPSWEDKKIKKVIIEFVEEVTDPNDKDFVAENERIAVFDNDGTLWCEQPEYPPVVFVRNRAEDVIVKNAKLKTEQPYKALLEKDMAGVSAHGDQAWTKFHEIGHSGLNIEEYNKIVEKWLVSALHPRFKRPYTELVYQPMLELMDYLRSKNFKVYIVSGGSLDFMRVFAEKVYGVSPDHVIGTLANMEYVVVEGKPEIRFTKGKEASNVGKVKPVSIQRVTGKRPILAFGNSDGDCEMLEWTIGGEGKRLGLMLHHDDEREYVYDRESHVGRLCRGLDKADGKRWIIVSMKKDWKTVFPEPSTKTVIKTD